MELATTNKVGTKCSRNSACLTKNDAEIGSEAVMAAATNAGGSTLRQRRRTPPINA